MQSGDVNIRIKLLSSSVLTENYVECSYSLFPLSRRYDGELGYAAIFNIIRHVGSYD